MASFLRKKTKTESPTKSPTKVSASVTGSTSPPPPPLFARFATTNSNAEKVAPRIVSSPMLLASQRRDRDLPQRVASGRGLGQSTTSLTTGGRDMNPHQRKMSDGHQGPSSPINGTVHESNLVSTQQLAKSPPRPISRVIVDKPLPPPSSAIINEYRTGAPSEVVNRRTTLNKGPGPPPSFQPPQPQVPRSRASLDMRDLESKPLPRPGSAQASYQSAQDPRGPPPSNYKFPPTATPKRNTSVSSASTSMAPQIGPPITSNNHKTQPTAFPYGQQHPPTTDPRFPSQTLSPQVSQRPVIVDDFPKDRVNGIGGVTSKRMSSVGPSRNGPQGTPMSDRGLDLPPEFALFQDYRDAISIPGTPNVSDARRLPADSIKPTGQVPHPSIPGSGVYLNGEKKPQPVVPQSGSNKPHPPSPPLPPPPPPDMGITASHAIGSDVLSSSYKDFRSPHMMSPMNGPTSLYNSVINVNSHPQHPLPNGRSTSPPLPPGAAPPANLPSLPRKNSKMGSMRPQNPNPHQPTQGQYPSPPPAHRPNPPPPTAVMLQKTPSMQAAGPPLRGKPRIFAAMESLDNDGGLTSQNTFQSQQNMTQPPQPQPQLVGPNRPPLNQHNPREHQPQHPLPLLPPVEFTSPKLQSSLLLNDFSGEVDPRSTPASITPPSVKASISDHSGRYPDSIVPKEFDPISRTPKSTRAPSLHRQDEPVPQLQSPQSTPRVKKLSKSRNHAESSSISSSNGVLQSSPEHSRNRSHRSASNSKSNPPTPMMTSKTLQAVDQAGQDVLGDVGIPLDDDPFARVEGVKMLKPTTPTPSESLGKGSVKGVSASSDNIVEPIGNDEERKAPFNGSPGTQPVTQSIVAPLTPESPEKSTKSKSKKDRKGTNAADAPPTVEESILAAIKPASDPVTMVQILSDPKVLSCLLSYLSFYDWCLLSAISKEIRILLVRTPDLRETVLETYLKTIGYCRWSWEEREPLSLSLQDLSDYMRGVSVPSHEYARVAAMHVHSLSIHPNHRDPSLGETVRALTACTRAYSRVLLRLRAQAEKEASFQSLTQPQHPPSTPSSKSTGGYSSRGYTSRVSSRAPSPTTSNNSHSYNGAGHGLVSMQQTPSQTSLTFRSPLFRLRRAPLLRVFVPSPEGDWLSDKSVLECEAECKRAGIMHLLRLGDVIWDVAVGDEGNVGRLVWDGSYLIDLDYTYSTVGDLPKYLPTLAFPPSYFHRVIRTGSNASNPIIHMDLSPWGEEIAMNLQLLQDRVRTETPQGAYHNVVRWVHRSSFSIRPPRGPNRYNKGPPLSGRIPIPESPNLFVDSGWYGTIVVETEGTNEALADLQDRCGPGAFPPRPRGVAGQVSQAQIENRKVFRILREKSRPGEIWIKAVSVKERLL